MADKLENINNKNPYESPEYEIPELRKRQIKLNSSEMMLYLIAGAAIVNIGIYAIKDLYDSYLSKSVKYIIDSFGEGF